MDTVINWLNGSGSSDDKLQQLKRNVRALSARVEDINNEVTQEELQPGKRRRREVDNWLKDVDDTLDQLQHLDHQCKDLSSSKWSSSNQTYRLSEQIRELIDQGSFPKGLTFYDHGSSSVALVTADIKITDNTLHNNKRKVVSWLTEDETISTIGVYGPGGVGKTMLLKETHNELLERYKSSRSVYWVSLSHGTTLPVLQDKIAEAMDLSYLLMEKNTIRKAASLFYELKHRKNVFLFVDDVWDHFSFQEVGIPVGENGCKLILTTRSLDVCRRMKCHKVLKVQPLSKEKAWELFTEVLGRGEFPADIIKELAGLIAAECAGLPLGLIVMAGSMRGVDDIEEWRNTLEELRNSTEGQTVIETELFPVLKLSFDRLKDPKLRQCFLLCAMYPKYSEIKRDELIRIFRSEGLLDTMETWQKQFDKGHSILNKLENVCLLETYGTRCVKMHNFIRDMAIRITTVMPRFMMAAGLELRTIPSGPNWKPDLEKASLMHNSLSEIEPGTIPMCPCLTTLLLQNNPFTKLPDSFFSQMNSLKVLNLSKTCIKKLPDIISELRNLRALLLEFCSRLYFVPSLVKLTNLRELDFSFCWSMKDVPNGMEQLTDLRFLDLEGSKDLCRLLSRSVSKLSRIQYLNLDPDVQSISADDFVKLGYLERLEGCRIADISSFNRYAKTQHFQQLNYFEFFIGAGEYKRVNYSTSDERTVILCSGILRSSDGDCFVLPENTQNLQIHNSELVRNLIDALPSLARLKELKKILIRRCKVVEVICSPQSLTASTSVLLFQCLQELILTDLLDFRGLIMEGVFLPQDAFPNLKILVIKFCPKIKGLLTPNLLNGNLDNLQELEVEGCDELEEVIVTRGDVCCQQEFLDFEGYDNKESNLSWLPNLRTLQLRRLPKLTALCHGGLLGKGSIEQIAVEYCSEIKNIFWSSLPQIHLKNLREVKVAGCQILQEIVSSPASKGKQNGIFELPNLKAIELDDLPRLTSFFRENIPICDSIEKITVRECPRVKRLPVSIPLHSNGEQLAQLSLREIKGNREWWESLKWDDTQFEQILLPFTKLSEANELNFTLFEGLGSRNLQEHDKLSSKTKVKSVDMSSCLTS